MDCLNSVQNGIYILSKRKQRLLMCGFTHQITNLDDNIPQELIELCFQFYSIIPTKIFITQQKYLSLHMTDVDVSVTKFKVKIKRKYHKRNHISFGCFVPDLSSKINGNIHRHLDGIIGFYKDTTTPHDLYLSLFMFDFWKQNKKQITCNLFISKETAPIKYYTSGNCVYRNADLPVNLFYHETAESIIYTSRYKVYAIPLNKIMLPKRKEPKFHIEELSTINRSLFGEDKTNQIRSRNIWMEQIYKSNKCFAITDGGIGELNGYKKIKCVLFDLNTNKWTIEKDLLLQDLHISDKVSFGICKQNYYKHSTVYVATNSLHVAQYDINKDYWSILHGKTSKKLRYQPSPYLWMETDPFILHFAKLPFFATFDVRDNNGWMKTNKFHKKNIYTKCFTNDYSVFM